MCFGNGARALLCIFVFLSMAGPPATAQPKAPVPIYVDTYRPYILPPGAPQGRLMRLVHMVLQNAQRGHSFVYEDYAYGFHATQTADIAASFPWRKTADWSARVLYSRPLVTIETGYFYNQRFHRQPLGADDLSGLRLGRLESYGYEGAVLAPLERAQAEDRLVLLQNEMDAISALLAGTVDAVPLQKVVAQATLGTQFANLAQLILPVSGVQTSVPFHLIAPKTDQGAALIAAFNQSFDALEAAGVLSADYANRGIQPRATYDFVTLVVAEGFPTIIGTAPDDPELSFALPEGTRALVLGWSARLREPVPSGTLFQTMVDETSLLILNGPHVGRELRVKNMHIAMSNAKSGE
ncbi:MAG: hypothetical protein AAF221_14310 [Pseudomonadota bacterium]